MPQNKKQVNQFERDARESVIEDLFYDFNKNRTRVYLTNFFRGISFGVGSVIGATLFVAISVSILNNFTDIPGGIGDFIRTIVDRVQTR